MFLPKGIFRVKTNYRRTKVDVSSRQKINTFNQHLGPFGIIQTIIFHHFTYIYIYFFFQSKTIISA